MHFFPVRGCRLILAPSPFTVYRPFCVPLTVALCKWVGIVQVQSISTSPFTILRRFVCVIFASASTHIHPYKRRGPFFFFLTLGLLFSLFIRPVVSHFRASFVLPSHSRTLFSRPDLHCISSQCVHPQDLFFSLLLKGLIHPSISILQPPSFTSPPPLFGSLLVDLT